MVLFFKKKRIEERKKTEKPVEKPKEEIEAPKKAVGGEAYPVRNNISNGAYKILKTPHITEKATDLTEKNQYIFKVWPRANKVEIKKAIENLYGVEVIAVKIINIPQKRRRLGRIEGWRKGYKKAIIRIKEGQKIEVLPR